MGWPGCSPRGARVVAGSGASPRRCSAPRFRDLCVTKQTRRRAGTGRSRWLDWQPTGRTGKGREIHAWQRRCGPGRRPGWRWCFRRLALSAVLPIRRVDHRATRRRFRGYSPCGAAEAEPECKHEDGGGGPAHELWVGPERRRFHCSLGGELPGVEVLLSALPLLDLGATRFALGEMIFQAGAGFGIHLTIEVGDPFLWIGMFHGSAFSLVRPAKRVIGRAEFEFALELTIHQVEGFGHAGFDGTFGNVEDLGNFTEFEVLVMAQDQNGTVSLRQVVEGLSDEIAFFGLCGVSVGRGPRTRRAWDRPSRLPDPTRVLPGAGERAMRRSKGSGRSARARWRSGFSTGSSFGGRTHARTLPGSGPRRGADRRASGGKAGGSKVANGT